MATRPMILGPDGQPIRREVLTSDQARPTLTGVRQVQTGYPGDGLNPQRLAGIMRQADQGDPLRYLELAEQIEERDQHYTGVLGTRKRSVAQLPIVVDAASDSAKDVEIADMVRRWLERDELQDELFDILDAVGKGYSFTEIVWDTSEGQWRPVRLEWRDPRWFEFDKTDGRTPLLKTDEGPQPLPGFKYIQARIRAKSGLPVRSGLARLACWSWMFKAFNLRDWAIFTQTYGQPIRVGKWHAGASDADKDALFRAVANVAGDCACIIPQGMEIEFVESKSIGASGELYEKRADWLDRQVSKSVLGQTATTDAIAGGHAVGQEHRQVQEDIERADCKATAAPLNRDLIIPWVILEYGPQPAYPKLRIGRQEERDLKLTLDAIKTFVPMGMKVQASVVRDLINIADPDDDSELLHAPASAPAAAPPEDPDDPEDDEDPEEAPQAPRRGDALDGLVDAALEGWEELADPVTDPILAAIEAATSEEDLRRRLEEILASDVPTAAAPLLERIARSLFVARAAGDVGLDPATGTLPQS